MNEHRKLYIVTGNFDKKRNENYVVWEEEEDVKIELESY